jgi:CRISPR/Cas system-associated exonuclease Cas4 (RecB family)
MAGVPVSGPSATLLKDTAPGKLVTHLLECIKSDFSRVAIMHWIAESPVKATPNTFPAQKELAKWEIISQSAGIVKGADQWRERLDAYRNVLSTEIASYDHSDEIDLSQLNGLKEQANSLESLSRLVTRLTSIIAPPDGSSYSVFANWLRGMIKEYAYEPANWVEDGQRALEQINNVIDEVGSIDKLIPAGATLSDFTTLLERALEKPTGRAGVTGEGVFVASVALAGGMDFDRVYITGMSESAFPPHQPIDPLLPDTIRKEFLNRDILPLLSVGKIKERRNFLAAVAAGKTCVLSFCQTDATVERGQYPSPWFMHELEKLNGSPVSIAEIGKLEGKSWLSLIFSTEHALKIAVDLPPADGHDYDMVSLERCYTNLGSIQNHFLLSETTPAGKALKMEKARLSADFSPWDGNLTSVSTESPRIGFSEDSHFSPTRLEKWVGCPMNYFFGHVLAIPVYEKPEEIFTIQAKDRGSLVHRILERFITTLVKANQLPDYGEAWNNKHEILILKLANEEFDQVEKMGITGHRFMWVMSKEEMEQDLVTFLAQDSKLRAVNGLKPVRVEQSFGMYKPGSLPPVILHVNDKEIKLHGFIDRFDSNRAGDKVFVIDYKTGSSFSYSGMKKDPLENGKRLQLPVYGLAIRNSLGIPVEINACYWFISTKGNFERREVILSAIEKKFAETVATIVIGIEKGLFPAYPGKNGNENCTYCDFDRICAADRDLMWERKAKAPELAAYIKLINIDSDKEADS